MGLLNLFRKKDKKPSESAQAKPSPVTTTEKTIATPSFGSIAPKAPSAQVIAGESITPVSSMLSTLYPNAAGLYPHEILALEYAPRFCVDDKEFQGFWWYKYGVQDVASLLDSLKQRGLLSLGTIVDNMKLYKVPELKAVLAEHGIKTTGKKDDLINRLVESVPEIELSKAFPRCPYKVTEAGTTAIKDDEYVLYAHRHQYDGIDIFSLNRLLKGRTKRYRDAIWKHFNQKSMEYAKQGMFGLYRNIRFQMSEFVAEEQRYKEAALLLVEVVYYDISGLDNSALSIEISGSYWFPYDHSIATTAPGIVGRLKEYQEKLALDDKAFQQLISEHIKKLSSPFHIFTKDECVDIIVLEMKEDKVQISKMYEKAKKRLQKQYPKVNFENHRNH